MRGDQETQSASILYLFLHFPLFFVGNHQRFANSSRTPAVRCSGIRDHGQDSCRHSRAIWSPQSPPKTNQSRLPPASTSFPEMAGSGLGVLPLIGFAEGLGVGIEVLDVLTSTAYLCTGSDPDW